MQYRFADVKFILPLSLPGGGNTIGYVAFFLICYISIRILLGQIKDKLVKALTEENILAAHIGDVTDEPLENGKRIYVER